MNDNEILDVLLNIYNINKDKYLNSISKTNYIIEKIYYKKIKIFLI